MTRRLCAFIVITGALLAAAAPQPQPFPGWVTARLEALRPDDAWPYFLLAEEVGYELRSQPGRELARTLFVLSYHLDSSLGSHVCLALADLSSDAEERQWLLAMGESMGVTTDDPPVDDQAGDADAQVPLRLAEGLRALRAEDGRALRETADSPAINEYLSRLEETHPTTASALIAARADALGKSGCPRCRSQRIVTENANRKETVICPRCGGNPGLTLDEDAMLASLRLEARLRGVEPATWSGVLILHQDHPLRDIRPQDLAQTYAIDTDATVWSPASGWHAPGGR